MTISFSAEVQEILRASGWTPDHRAAVSGWLQELEEAGFSPSPLATELLEALGGIKVVPRQGEGCAFFSAAITFDPLLEASADYEDLLEWADEYSLTLFPVGLTDDGIRILVSPEGKFFGAMSDMFFGYGEDVGEAMDILILARSAPEVLA